MFRVIKSLGVVYGDIGTSPMYTLAVALLLLQPSSENIYGVVSLIFWTLTILVSIQYAWLATSLSKRGEGGTIVLAQILLGLIKSKKAIFAVLIVGVLGVSLMIGDGIITPAISILSAVEGVLIVPGFEHTPDIVLLMLAVAICVVLFRAQSGGIERIAGAFGFLMTFWFLLLAILGLYWMIKAPEILWAINPYHIYALIKEDPTDTFIILSVVILCATGGEALYADMGHLGRLPILEGWIFVFAALFLNYFGQAAYLLLYPESKAPFFEMAQAVLVGFYPLFLFVAILAAIIASQAMISGISAVIYQAINTNLFPRLKIEYTSSQLRSQIYITIVNWSLFVSVVFMLLVFQHSSALASAYGLAVAGAMSITASFMVFIFAYQKRYIHLLFSVISALTSILFFASCMLKIPYGGYYSLLLASVPFVIIVIYVEGQKRLDAKLEPQSLEHFLALFSMHFKSSTKLEGTAIFLTRTYKTLPKYIADTMFLNGIIYEKNVLVSIKSLSKAYGMDSRVKELEKGLYLLVISAGYMESVNIESVLREHKIIEKTVFYGAEDITPTNLAAWIYALIKRVSPSFAQFYKMPTQKLIGIHRRVIL